jgi:nickel-type superoxide dismutase maturation protease
MRRLVTTFGTALLFSFGTVAVIGRVAKSWEARIAVRGHSMEPTLLDGDWLLVDPDAFARRAPRVGQLVVARDPREAARVVVKRVAAVDSAGSLTLAGDHPAHADDGESIGALPASALLGRPWFRYWPRSRFGPI